MKQPPPPPPPEDEEVPVAGSGVAAAVVVVEVVEAGVGAEMVANVAVTLLAASRTTVQVPVPVQAPLQPAKVKPVAGVALKAMLVPPVKLALQVAPQSIPLGLEATVPLPVLVTVRE
jgi:hypothetical protein